VQESRIQEIRDTHRLEGSSQSELISKLRQQLATAETALAQKTSDNGNVAQLKEDLAKAQTTAKDEEEKRSKAISLLKTVRMKLVKAEKDKEEVEKDRAEERAERSSAREEVERVKAEKEREVNSLRKGFERETQGIKDRAEKDLAAKKADWELEMITTKVSCVVCWRDSADVRHHTRKSFRARRPKWLGWKRSLKSSVRPSNPYSGIYSPKLQKQNRDATS